MPALTASPLTRMVTRLPPLPHLRSHLPLPGSLTDHGTNLFGLQLQQSIDGMLWVHLLGTSEEQPRSGRYVFGEDANIVEAFVAGDCGDELAEADIWVGDGELLC